MVLVTIVRQSAIKRIPLIKFRRQRDQGSASRSSDLGASQAKGSVSGVGAISLPPIEDWQLPQRYRRRPIDQTEIEYINRGGPA